MECVGGRVDPKDGKKKIIKRNIQKAEKWKLWINMKKMNSSISFISINMGKLNFNQKTGIFNRALKETNPAVIAHEKIQVNHEGMEMLK